MMLMNEFLVSVCLYETITKHTAFSGTERWYILTMARIVGMVFTQSRRTSQRKLVADQKATVFIMGSSNGQVAFR